MQQLAHGECPHYERLKLNQLTYSFCNSCKKRFVYNVRSMDYLLTLNSTCSFSHQSRTAVLLVSGNQLRRAVLLRNSEAHFEPSNFKFKHVGINGRADAVHCMARGLEFSCPSPLTSSVPNRGIRTPLAKYCE